MKSIIAFVAVGIIILGIASCKEKSKSNIDVSEVEKSFDDFNKRKIYVKLDSSTLASIPDDKLEQAIIDFITSKFNKDFSNEYEIVTSLSPGLKAVYSTWILEAEVNNGGFNQFYWNSSGRFAKEAEDGLFLIGALSFLKLMKEANKIYEQEKPRMQEFKDKGTIEAFSESYKETKLNELDDKFYKLTENLSALRIKYIRLHPEDFMSDVANKNESQQVNPARDKPPR